METKALMTGEAYDAAIKMLVEAHPEDLINILSRVIHDRDELKAGKFNTGQVTVPGCPGTSDCTDLGHTKGHLAVSDTTFTVSVSIKGQAA